MTIKLYFEALTKGMHAKMNSRYVPHKQAVRDKDRPSPPKVTTPKLSRTGFLGDAIIRAPYRERNT